MSDWDSIATVTLITLIEEEFDIEVEAEDLERLVSFDFDAGISATGETRALKVLKHHWIKISNRNAPVEPPLTL